VNGKWYIFYHRQTGRDEFSRQAMLEPIEADIGRDGRIFLGKIRYENGEPVASGPVEMTSQGPQINGLNAREWISAGYACHLYCPGGETRPWIARTDDQREDASAPVMDISDGTTVGFRYLQFGANTPKTATVRLRAEAPLTLQIRLDDWQGRVIAEQRIEKGEGEFRLPLKTGIIGKHAVYFAFTCKEKGSVASFDQFTFD
jgi:hypothetical protein